MRFFYILTLIYLVNQTFASNPVSFNFPTELPLWAKQQITEDLKPHIGKTLSHQKIKTFFQQNKPLLGRLGIVHVQVRSGEIVFEYEFPKENKSPGARCFLYRLEPYKQFLTKLNNIYPLPDMDFLLNLTEAIDRNTHFFAGFSQEEAESRIPFEEFKQQNILEIPIFSFAGQWNHPLLILIPDPQVVDDPSYSHRFPDSILWGIPWDTKEQKIFWRGYSSGGAYTVNNWQSFPRSKLALLSKTIPDVIDASFTPI